ncbi:MAG: hypothetical protein Kow0031_10090 [Anaerolineae bacterium]
MSNKVFSQFQQNLTTWTLLFVILILAGVAVFLRPQPDTTPETATPPAASAPASPAPAAETAPPGDSWLPNELILALQVAVGAGFLGYLIGYKRGQRNAFQKIQQSKPDAPPGASSGNGTNRDSTTCL